MASHSYEADLALWAEDQSRALREASQSGVNLPVDWLNVAEEIEALGRSQPDRRDPGAPDQPGSLAGRGARAGWRETIQRQRDDIERVLADSPSLRGAVPAVVEKEIAKARRLASMSLSGLGERPAVDVEGLYYMSEQVLGDWFPRGG